MDGLQEYLQKITYAKLGRQRECIMGDSKIGNKESDLKYQVYS